MRLGHVAHLFAIGLVTAAVAGCGGGSSTGASSGGGSGAVVQGQVRTTRSAANRAPVVVVVLQKALGIGVAEAQNGTDGEVPLAGAEVTITCDSGFTATTTTDENGRFLFQGVPPGMCTLTVNDDPLTATMITVGDGDTATVVGTVTQDEATGTVTVAATDVNFQNDAQLGHAMNIALANGTQCDLGEVWSKRTEGRQGWGPITRQCGVHPGVLGLGRSNLSDEDLEAGRADIQQTGGRSIGKGKGKGHGKGPKKKA